MFDEDDVIFEYGDDDAIRDGVLVRVKTLGITPGAIDIMTTGVFESFTYKNANNEEIVDIPKVKELLSYAESEMRKKNDRFYAIKHKGQEYFIGQNETAFTIMLPEEY